MRAISLVFLLSLGACSGCGDDTETPDAGEDAGLPDMGFDAGLEDAGLEDAGVEDAGLEDAGIVRKDGSTLLTAGSDERATCRDRDPLRRPFFGDLHVHTRFSFDAAAYDVRSGPADAYRFARGERIGLPPYDGEGEATRSVQLERPLDFAAVTDHAVLLAPTTICTDPESPGYDSGTCQQYRSGDPERADFGLNFLNALIPVRREPRLCRDDPALCDQVLCDVWEETIQAAEDFYDRTEDCGFTTFVGYEWTGTRGTGQSIHRNVIFRNATVPAAPFSYLTHGSPEALWDALESVCLEDEDCDVLAIPHNSNQAVGEMFNPMTEAGEPYDAAFSARRQALEPLVEIYQHKGSSECVTGIADPLASEDELCGFELFYEDLCEDPDNPTEGCTNLCDPGAISFIGGCIPPSDYVRGALRRGLAERLRTGANPFELGFIASTDTHNGTPGEVREAGWQGHVGNTDDEARELVDPPGGITLSQRTSSPGGLAVVWAEENSREALFEAMRRRETYATSGPRFVVRFFGGFGLPEEACTDLDVAALDAAGVPMGGTLGDAPAGEAPSFVVSALQDALGAPLQRLQIVKGWADPATGETFERVFDVAGDAENGATVDLATCTPMGEGAASLCDRWVDPDFDPAEPAFYYARVVENPTCRWTQRLCLSEAFECEGADPADPLVPVCCTGATPPTVQERAWTSPIFYVP
ncbi:MAG: DUF3604 domain-containing protein [Myxococcota bacterium]